jgi:hypothetical protein
MLQHSTLTSYITGGTKMILLVVICLLSSYSQHHKSDYPVPFRYAVYQQRTRKSLAKWYSGCLHCLEKHLLKLYRLPCRSRP